MKFEKQPLFTYHDLLKHMGLTTGCEVVVNGKQYKITWQHKDIGKGAPKSQPILYRTFTKGFQTQAEKLPLSYLFGKDYSVITPPKFTLTETEKRIVLAIDENIELLHRNNGRLSFGYQDRDVNVIPIMEWVEIPVSKLFPFIKDNDYVSLDELREIAKGEQK